MSYNDLSTTRCEPCSFSLLLGLSEMGRMDQKTKMIYMLKFTAIHKMLAFYVLYLKA